MQHHALILHQSHDFIIQITKFHSKTSPPPTHTPKRNKHSMAQKKSNMVEKIKPKQWGKKKKTAAEKTITNKITIASHMQKQTNKQKKTRLRLVSIWSRVNHKGLHHG